MKNLVTIIALTDEDIEELEYENDVAGRGILVTRTTSKEVTVTAENLPLLMDPDLNWFKVEVPAEKVGGIANIEGEVSIFLDAVRDSAKRFVKINKNAD